MRFFLSAWELRGGAVEQDLRESKQFVGLAKIEPTWHTGQLSTAAIIRLTTVAPEITRATSANQNTMPAISRRTTSHKNAIPSAQLHESERALNQITISVPNEFEW